MENKLNILYDPSTDQVFGVLQGLVYCDCICDDEYEEIKAVIVMTQKLFQKTWKNWLEQKGNICERYEHFCGVTGYTVATKYKVLEDKITVVVWNSRKEQEEVEERTLIEVLSFDKLHDFEHG